MNFRKEKNEINNLIYPMLNEIIYKGLKISSLGLLEENLEYMLEILRKKNKIFDFVINVEYNPILKKFFGIIIYSIVNTSKMKSNEAEKFEEEINFNF